MPVEVIGERLDGLGRLGEVGHGLVDLRAGDAVAAGEILELVGGCAELGERLACASAGSSVSRLTELISLSRRSLIPLKSTALRFSTVREKACVKATWSESRVGISGVPSTRRMSVGPASV